MKSWQYEREKKILEEDLKRNLDLAEKFSHNPGLEKKFLDQAIECEKKLAKYQ